MSSPSSSPWPREARPLLRRTRKFLNHHRDLLAPERAAEMDALRAELRTAIKARDEAAIAQAAVRLNDLWLASLAELPPHAGWQKVVQILWVIAVFLISIRAYGVQIFRIPTGSMQPTLNGVNLRPSQDNSSPPGWLGRWLAGQQPLTLVSPGNGRMVRTENRTMLLQTQTIIHFTDGSSLVVPAAEGEATKLFIDPASHFPKSFRKGEIIFQGVVQAGDMVLVNKAAYHFRPPHRGEIAVFDTRGLETHGAVPTGNQKGEPTTYYVKRLTGMPGDAVSIHPPDLIVNGASATEPGIRQIADSAGVYGQLDPFYHPAKGYTLVPNPYARIYSHAMARPGDVMTMARDVPAPLREYMMVGDNTGNSADSRHWGPVKGYTLTAPASFVLWPFESGHWGFIR